MNKKNRSVSVTVFGWYFILQGWIALGYLGKIGLFALVFVALFLCIGIGMLKLLKPAYVGAVIFSVSVIVVSLITLVSHLDFIGTPLMGPPVAGLIIGMLILFFLSRKSIKEQFK